jgi:5-methylcytosine-specific restriction endonuclease McrA
MHKYNNDEKNIPRIKQQKSEWFQRQPKESLKMKREMEYFDGMREAVLERDNRKCAECGEENERKLVIHHIDKNGRGHSNPNNSMSNLLTLCRKCHLLVHKKEIDSFKFKLGDRWSRDYDSCIKCHTTKVKYNGKGMCKNCYATFMRDKKPKKFKFEWSIQHPSCQICGTTEVRHEGHGLCYICYQTKANKDIVRSRKKLREGWRKRPS